MEGSSLWIGITIESIAMERNSLTPEFCPRGLVLEPGAPGRCPTGEAVHMLEARSLTKYYSHTPAVRHVSFTIRPGEILGYLGPNGAGKSTTVKMLTGLIEPSDGQILYNGQTVYDDFTGFQRRIGYVPEEPHLYPHLTGREYLQLVGRLRGIARIPLDSKMDEFLRLFSLWDDRHSPLASYSKGMRQKILLSAALLHYP